MTAHTHTCTYAWYICMYVHFTYICIFIFHHLAMYFFLRCLPLRSRIMKAKCVCVCVLRVSRAAAQRHTIFTAPAPFVYFDTWGLVSRTAQRQQRRRRTFCYSYSRTHTLLFVRRALAESSSLLSLSLSLLFPRSVACKCGECNMQRASAVDPPTSVSFPSPLPLSHHSLPRLTSSLLRCSASLSATVTHLLCFNNSHTFVCSSGWVCVSP